MTLTILKTESFQPLGKPIPRPSTTPEPKPVQIKPGVFKGVDGRLYTEFATGQSVAPAKKAAPATPLPVVPNALGDGWIEWGGGECPIPTVKAGEWMRRNRLGQELINDTVDAIDSRCWCHKVQCSADIVAYRLLPKEPA